MIDIDPANTSKLDGASCALCGDDAVEVREVEGKRLPLCGSCCDEQITNCPDCQTTIFQANGVRVFSAPELYCHACSRTYPHMQAGYIQELRADETRDEDTFNRTRR